jgi:hypothetical protein
LRQELVSEESVKVSAMTIDDSLETTSSDEPMSRVREWGKRDKAKVLSIFDSHSHVWNPLEVHEAECRGGKNNARKGGGGKVRAKKKKQKHTAANWFG